MISQRSHLVREKRFRTLPYPERRRGQLTDATLTDDHTLLLLHQHRERRSRVEGRWIFSRLARLFRRA